MSVNQRHNKKNPTGLYQQGVTKLSGEGAAGFTRVESWITPEKLKNQYLFGIPLTSVLTKQTLTDDTLKDIIRRAAATVELKCKVDVTPTQRVHRIEFDRVKYLQGWNQLQLGFGNIQSLQEVSIRANNSHSPPVNPIIAPPGGAVRSGGVVTITTANLHHLFPGESVTIDGVSDASFNGDFQVVSTPTSSIFTFNQAGPDATAGNGMVAGTGDEGSVLYRVPLEWIDMSMCAKGLLHFVPLQTTFGSYGVSGPAAGAAAPLFAIFSQLQWIPSFWCVKAIHGFEENAIPAPFNDLIGCYAAMEVLSLLGPLLRYTSQSISLDGASQATSGPGNQLYVIRYQQLEAKVVDLLDLIKSRFGKKIFMSHM